MFCLSVNADAVIANRHRTKVKGALISLCRRTKAHNSDFTLHALIGPNDQVSFATTLPLYHHHGNHDGIGVMSPADGMSE